jgi:hypothetical protein
MFLVILDATYHLNMANRLANMNCNQYMELLKDFEGKSRNGIHIRFYKILAFPTLLYGSETWDLRKKDETRIQSVKMAFLRTDKGCIKSSKIKNDDIREEFNIAVVRDKLNSYKMERTS